MSEIIIEKLLEQRDFYLNTLKQLEFQLVMDPTENEIKEIVAEEVPENILRMYNLNNQKDYLRFLEFNENVNMSVH